LITLKLYQKRDTTVDIVIILTTRSVFLYYTVWNTELSRTSNVSMKKESKKERSKIKFKLGIVSSQNLTTSKQPIYKPVYPTANKAVKKHF